MKKITIDMALAAIQKNFYGLASILNIDSDGILDIICTDLHTGDWYEVFTDENWSRLNFRRINL